MKTAESVNHRAVTVDDIVCKECSQNWYNECRLYCIPHSKEEAKQRGLKDPNCVRSFNE